MTDRQAYYALRKVMKEIDYYKKYPTRLYLKEWIEEKKTYKEKAQIMMQDSLVQQAVIPDWLHARHTMGDPLEYFKKLNSRGKDDANIRNTNRG